jgi:hypothetical protein
VAIRSHVDRGQLDAAAIVVLIGRCRQAFNDYGFPGAVASGEIGADHWRRVSGAIAANWQGACRALSVAGIRIVPKGNWGFEPSDPAITTDIRTILFSERHYIVPWRVLARIGAV